MEGSSGAAALVLASAFLLALVLYLAGKLVAARGTKTEAELSPYACGEVLPPVRPRMDMSRFFVYVLLFLVFDIAVPIIALAILGHYLQAAIYLAIMSAASIMPALYLRELLGR